MPLTNRAVAASDSSPLELCWLSQQDHSFIFLIQRIEHKKPARSTDNTRSFKSSLLGARCRGCGPHAPAPRSGGSGHFLSPLFHPRRCEPGERSGAAPGQRSQLGISLLSSWFRQERRCAGYLPCDGQPGWLALSFVTIELSRFQPGVHGSVENAAVSAGCNVSSGASEAASAFYLGSARGTALPRPRGKPKPLRLMPMHPRFGLAEGALLLGGHVQGPH